MFDPNADRIPIAVGVDVGSRDFVVGAAQHQDFMDKKIAIIAFSEIRYYDIFRRDIERVSQACYEVTFGGGSFTDETGRIRPNFKTRPYGLQNKAD